jgi:hypothetical protein
MVESEIRTIISGDFRSILETLGKWSNVSNVTKDYFDRTLLPALKGENPFKSHPKYGGFKVFRAPLLENAPALFVGYNPSYTNTQGKNEWEDIPETSEYAIQHPGGKGIFNAAIREIWPDLYRRCPAMNAVYFRSTKPSRLPLSKRKAEEFCLPHTHNIIARLRPHNLILIGETTADFLGYPRGEVVLSSRRGKPGEEREKNLIYRSRHPDVPHGYVYVVPHLSGAFSRPWAGEIEKMRAYFEANPVV